MATFPPPLDPYNAPFKPLSNITPFTYRDGTTYLEILSDLRFYIDNTVIPYINTNFTGLGDDFEQQVNTLIDTVNAELAAQTTSVEDAIATVTTSLATRLTAITAGTNVTVSTTTPGTPTAPVVNVPGVVGPTPGTLMARDANGRSQAVSPSAPADVATKGYVDALVGGGVAGVTTVVAGSHIAVDSTDAHNPIISATGLVSSTGSVSVAHVTDGAGAETTKAYTDSPTVSTMVSRDASGRSKFVDPISGQDAATKNYVDTTESTLNTAKVDKVGTANIAYTNDGSGNPSTTALTAAATASTLMKRDAAGRVAVADPSAASDAMTKGFADGAYAPIVKRLPQNIIALGTSITAGSLTAGADWTDVYAARVALINSSYPAVSIVNAGVSGDTGASELARIAALITGNPTYGTMAIEVSINDAQSATAFGVAPAVDNYREMIRLCNAAGIRPILIGTAPYDPATFTAAWSGVVAAINTAVRRLCERSCVTYVDLGTRLKGSTIWGGDGLHPTVAGQAAWAAAIAAAHIGYSSQDGFDDFARPDSSAAPLSSKSGHLWVPKGGTYGITSGKLYSVSAVANTVCIMATDSNDMTTSALIGVTQGSGLVIRHDGNNSYYLANLSGGNIYKVVSGTATSIGSFTALTGSNHRAEFTCSGVSLALYIDGALVYSANDSALAFGTFGGVYHSDVNTTTTWDDLAVVANVRG